MKVCGKMQSHIEYFKRIEAFEEKGKPVVCCATCHNERCKSEDGSKQDCLAHPTSFSPTRNHLLFWSEETGYLPKMHEKYAYIHWKQKPEFIRERDFSV
jgi:hypothetical protein